jgi:hypothetical protein
MRRSYAALIRNFMRFTPTPSYPGFSKSVSELQCKHGGLYRTRKRYCCRVQQDRNTGWSILGSSGPSLDETPSRTAQNSISLGERLAVWSEHSSLRTLPVSIILKILSQHGRLPCCHKRQRIAKRKAFENMLKSSPEQLTLFIGSKSTWGPESSRYTK